MNAQKNVNLYRFEIANSRQGLKQKTLAWLKEMVSRERLEDVALIASLLAAHENRFFSLIAENPRQFLGARINDPEYKKLIEIIQIDLQEIHELYTDARFAMRELRIQQLKKLDTLRAKLSGKIKKTIAESGERETDKATEVYPPTLKSPQYLAANK